MTNKNIGFSLVAVGTIVLIAGVFTIFSGNPESQKKQPTKIVQVTDVTSAKSANGKTSGGMSNAQKGKQFEEYVIKKFDFSRNSLRLVSRVETTTAKSSADLLVELTTQKAKYNIAIECAWRSDSRESALEWTKEEILNKILASAKKDKAALFLVLGEGGKPSYPNDLYIIPITSAKQYSIQNIATYRCNDLSGKFFYDGPTKKLTIK